MAHQEEAALDAAIQVCRDLELNFLVDHLGHVREDPSDPSFPQPKEAETLSAREQVVLGIVTCYPLAILCETSGDEGETPAEIDALLATGRQHAKLGVAWAESVGEPALVSLFWMLLASGCREQGDMQEAADAYAQALAIRKTLAATQPEIYARHVVATLINVCSLLRTVNQLNEAAACGQEAVDCWLRPMEMKHPGSCTADLADALNNLGNVYQAKHAQAEAKACYEEAVERYQRLSSESGQNGTFLSRQGTAWNNLGTVLRLLGDFAAAQKAMEKALEIRGNLPGAEKSLATTLNNLGNLFCDTGLHSEAESHYRNALNLQLQHGCSDGNLEDREDLAMTQNNLAAVLHDLMKLDEAEILYRQALIGYEALAAQFPEGEEAWLPRRASGLQNLGFLLKDLQRLDEAETTLKKARAIQELLVEQMPGVFELDLAQTLTNLGNLKREKPELEEAEKDLQKALELYQTSSGANPKSKAMAHCNLGVVQAELMKEKDAELSYLKAIECYRTLASKSAPGLHDQGLAMVCTNLGSLYHDEERTVEAMPHFAEAQRLYFKLSEQNLRMWGGHAAIGWNNLGNGHRNLGDMAAATQAFREADILYAKVSPFARGIYDHDWAGCLNNLGIVYRDEGKLAAAKVCFTKAISRLTQSSVDNPTALLASKQVFHQNLASLHLQQARAIVGLTVNASRSDLLESAVALFRQATEFATQRRSLIRNIDRRTAVMQRSSHTYDAFAVSLVELWQASSDPQAQWLHEAVEAVQMGRSRRMVDLMNRILPDHKESGIEKGQPIRRTGGTIAPDTRFDHLPKDIPTTSMWVLKAGPGLVESNPILEAINDNSSMSPFLTVPTNGDFFDEIRAERRQSGGRNGEKSASPIKYTEISAMLENHQDSVIVEYLLPGGGEHDGKAIIVSANRIVAINLPEFSREATVLAREWLNVVQSLLPSQGVGECIQTFMNRFTEWENGQAQSSHNVLTRLGQLALEPLLSHLLGFPKVILEPHYALHLLPLHACPVCLSDKTGCVSFSDIAEVSYTPSIL